MISGVVVKSTGSWYLVMLEDFTIVKCRIVGKFKINGMKLTNPVGVGDRVQFEYETSNQIDEVHNGVIKVILPRENYIVRQSPRQLHYLHLLAANVHQAILLTTIREPNLKQGFIDRFLLMTEPQNIPTIIVFNKSDILEAEDMELFESMRSIYEAIGYTVQLVSAHDSHSLEALKRLLKDKNTFMCGQSGVGKSTLINSIQPQLDIRTEEISDYSGKGQHTTTFAEMHLLDFGGTIIDSPGIKSLSFNNLSLQDVAHNFREIFVASSDCKYGDCLHRNEPNCNVKDKVHAGEIDANRYVSYLQILDEIENQNYWELHTDM